MLIAIIIIVFIVFLITLGFVIVLIDDIKVKSEYRKPRHKQVEQPKPPEHEWFYSLKASEINENGETPFFGHTDIIISKHMLWMSERTPIHLSDILWTDLRGIGVNIGYSDQDGQPDSIAFAPSHLIGNKKIALEFKKKLDLAVARVQLEARKNSGQNIAVQICPRCESLIDITDNSGAVQIFCPSCTLIFQSNADKLSADTQKIYGFCEGCCRYASVQNYAISRLSSVLVVMFIKGFNGKLCPTCARKKSWEYLWKSMALGWWSWSGVIANPIVICRDLINLIRSWLAYRRLPDEFSKKLQAANDLSKRGDAVESTRTYKEVLALNKDHAGVIFNLGLALYDQGKPEEARLVLDQSLKYCPNLPVNNLILAGREPTESTSTKF